MASFKIASVVAVLVITIVVIVIIVLRYSVWCKALGNYLVQYAATIAIAIYDGKKQFTIRGKRSKTRLNENLRMTFHYDESWDQIRHDLSKIFDSFTWKEWIYYMTFNKVNEWNVDRGVLRIIQPIYRNAIHDAISMLDYPIHLNRNYVIHHRCSDSPFNHHPHYKFIGYSWIVEAIDKARERVPLSEILILGCHKHQASTENQKSCKIYVEHLRSHLADKYGVTVITRCGSLDHDFITMVNSDCLISMRSSLSFMAGFASDNVFVYPAEKITNPHIQYRGGIIHVDPKDRWIEHEGIDYNKDIDRVLDMMSHT